MRAEGIVRPTALSAEYTISLTYRTGDPPIVRVLYPALQERDGKPPPHLYADGSLCLYRPKYREWTPGHLLTVTVIPWISEWLACYETWLVTEDWLCGGEYPAARKPRNGT